MKRLFSFIPCFDKLSLDRLGALYSILSSQGGYILLSLTILTALVPTFVLIGLNYTDVIGKGSRITKSNLTKTKMLTIRNIIASKAKDVDSDDYYEVLKEGPGNTVPSSISVNSVDEWGTNLRYCTWDLRDCNQTDPTYTQNNPNSPCTGTSPPVANLVLRIVSAGKDRVFQTSCASTSSLGDDIVMDETEAGIRVGGGGSTFWAASGNAIYNTNTGNVGIGTTTPETKLEVNGAIKSQSTNYNYSYAVDLTPFNPNIWYPVVLDGYEEGGPVKFEIIRDRTHADGVAYGTLHFVGIFNSHGWGNSAAQFQYKYEEQPDVRLVSYVGHQWHGHYIFVYLRGDRVYQVKTNTRIMNINRLGSAYTVHSGSINYEITVHPDTTFHDPPPTTRPPGGTESIRWRRVVRDTSLGLSGSVSIGTPEPGAYRLYVNGSAYSTGGWASSDIRWKKNIDSLKNQLDKILSIQGVSYEWNRKDFPDKGFAEGRQIGVIAQEIEKIIPEVVKTDNDGYKAVSYERLVPVLIEAIKEQQAQIEELKRNTPHSQINTAISISVLSGVIIISIVAILLRRYRR